MIFTNRNQAALRLRLKDARRKLTLLNSRVKRRDYKIECLELEIRHLKEKREVGK